MTEARAAATDEARLFRQRGFVCFWVARICSAGGYQMLGVAVAWQVWEIPGSAVALGLVGLAQFLPKLMLMPLAGNWADRFDRRRLVAAAQALQLLGLLMLVWANWRGSPPPGLIYAVLVVNGIGRSFEMPTTQALLPALVPAAMLARAVAMAASAFQLSTIAAPVVAGFLYALGPRVAYGVAGSLMALAVLAVLAARPLAAQTRMAPGRSAWRNFVDGLHFIRRQRAVLGAISLDMMAVLLGGATALLPIVASEILHVDARGLGLLRAAPAVGALAMSLWLARFALRRHVGRLMFASVALFGAATVLFGLSSSLALSIASLVVLGAADMVSMVFRGAYIQLATPDSMRGRVGAVNGLFIGASNQLGEFESGLTAAWLGVVPAIVIGGLASLVVAVVWARHFPELWHLDRLPSG